MVGNEVGNDIVPAKRVGMKTFFVTDDGNAPPDVPADWIGTLKEFGALIERGIRKIGTRFSPSTRNLVSLLLTPAGISIQQKAV